MKAWTGAGLALGGVAMGALLMWSLGPAAVADGDDKKPAAAESAEKSAAPSLDPATQAAAGIRVEPVAAARQGASLAGYARAIDLSPLAALAADAETARAAVAASGKQAARLAALAAQDQSAAPKDLEAARAQFAADRARLTLACRKVGLDFGAGLARLGCDGISRLVHEAAQGQAALVRIDMVQGPAPTGGTVTIGEAGDAVTAQILGPAASADPQLQTPGVLGLVRGPGAARLGVGRVLPVQVAGSGAGSGVLVPRAALMRADGGQFVYRAAGNGRFARVALSGGSPMAGGWFFPGSSLKPGDPIVVSGAATLLGLERGPQEAGGD